MASGSVALPYFVFSFSDGSEHAVFGPKGYAQWGLTLEQATALAAKSNIGINDLYRLARSPLPRRMPNNQLNDLYRLAGLDRRHCPDRRYVENA